MKTKYLAVIAIAGLFAASLLIVMMFQGLPGSMHLGGIINLGLAVACVHTLDLCDDRYSLYEEIIEEQNYAVAIAYSGWIVGACIAFPSPMF